MNRIYRVVWNASIGAWVAVSENAKSKTKTKTVKVVAVAIAIASSAVMPVYADVVAGKNITITPSGTDIVVATTDDVSLNKVTVGSVELDKNTNTVKVGTNTTLSTAGLDTDGLVKTGTLTTTGSATIGNGLTVADGATSLKNTNIAGTLTTTGNTTVGGTLEVTGATTLSNVTTTGSATIGSGLTVNGATALKNTNIAGTLTTTGNTTVGGTLNVTNTANLNNGANLNSKQITGLAAGTANTDAANYGQVKASKTEVAAGTNISVTPTTGGDGQTVYTVKTIDNPNFTTVTTTGAVNANSLAVTSNATVGGTLGVTGTTTLNDKLTVSKNGAAITGATTVTGTLGVTGTTTLNDKLTVSKNGAAITGATTVTGTLGVTGLATLNSGADLNNQKITKLAVGTADTDAVNLGQIKTLLSVDPSKDYNGIKYFRAKSTAADAQANGDESVAIGPQSKANGKSAISIGDQAIAAADSSISMGKTANAMAIGSISIGEKSIAYKDNNVAIGKEAVALGLNSTAIGSTTGTPRTPVYTRDANDNNRITAVDGIPVTTDPSTNGQNANDIITINGTPVDATERNNFLTLLGSGANLSAGKNSLAVGTSNLATGESSIALGDAAQAVANDAIATGRRAQALGENAISIGAESQAVVNAVVVGDQAKATQVGAVSIGQGAQTDTEYGVSVGYQAGTGSAQDDKSDRAAHIAIGKQAGQNVSGNRNIAIGVEAGQNLDSTKSGSADFNIAIGSEAGSNFTGNNNISIGSESNKNNSGSLQNSVALGHQTDALDGAVVIGYQAKAESVPGGSIGYNAVVVGANAKVNGQGGVALGKDARAGASNVALGISSVAESNSIGGGYLTGAYNSGSGVNVVSVGNVSTQRRITNVADGAAGTDAVNVNQLQQLNQNIKNVLGNDTTINPDGTLNFKVNGTSSSVQGAIEALSTGGGTAPANTVVYTDSSQKQVSLGGSGGTELKNVAAGTTGNSAVNKQQLDDAIATGMVKYVSINSTRSANKNNASAAATDSLAIGAGALTGNDANNSVSLGFDTDVKDKQSVAIGYKAISEQRSSVAMGDQAHTYNENNVAIGTGAQSKGTDSITIGKNAQADYDNSIDMPHYAIVVGSDAEVAKADQGISIGRKSFVDDANNGTAIGHEAKVLKGAQGTAIGHKSLVTANNATAVGNESRATGTSANAIGDDAQATGASSNAIGKSARASATSANALGDNAQATSVSSNAIGNQAKAYAENASAIGTAAQATGINANALGKNAYADKQDATAIGSAALATGLNANALGKGAEAIRQDATAIGTAAQATGTSATALGKNAEATGLNANAIGNGAKAGAESSNAIGTGADVSATNGFALGTSAKVTHTNAIALGSGSISGNATPTASAIVNGKTYNYAGINPTSTVSVGSVGNERQIINVAAGRVSASSTDAINGSQLFQTNEELANLANKTAQALGGGAAANQTTGGISAPSYTVTTNPAGAGTKTTVNNVGSALTALDTAVNQPLGFAGDTGTASRKLGETLNVKGGAAGTLTTGNIGVVANGSNQLDIRLAETVNLGTNGSVTTGSASIKNNEVKVGANTLTNTGLTVGTTQVTTGAVTGLSNTNWNPAGTYNSGRAATEEQLQSAQNQLNTTLTNKGFNITAQGANSDNIKLGETVDFRNTDGNLVATRTVDNTINYDLAKNISVDKVTVGGVIVDKDTGINAGNKVISNVASGGTVDSNAANIADVKAASSTVVKGTNVTSVTTNKTASGTTYTVNADGTTVSASSALTVTPGAKDANNVTNYAIDLSTTTKTDIQKGVDAKTATDKGLNFAVNGGAGDNVKLGETVNFADGSNTTAVYDISSNTYKYNLNDNITLSNAGSVTVGASKVDNSGVQAGSVKVSTSSNDITGLSNTTWNPAGTYNSGRAATEEQLQSAQNQLDTTLTNKGFNITAQGANSDNVKLGETVDFRNTDGNLVATRSADNTINYDLAKNINVDKVTAGNTVVNTNGVVITNPIDSTRTVSITSGGINAGGNIISNVASGGTVDTNAANIADVKKASSKVTNGTNVASVTSTSDANGTTYTVNADGTTVSAAMGGALSVTKGTKDISNVTDYAVDLSTATKVDIQKGVDAKTATDQGINFGGTTGSNKYALGDTIKVFGDSNITSTTTAGGAQLGLANSITIGDAATGKPVTINGNNGTIGGLTNTTWNGTATKGQAATEDQLKNIADNAAAATAAAKTEVKAGTSGNVSVTPDTTSPDGHTIYTVDIDKDLDLTNAGSVTVGDSKIDNSGVQAGTIKLDATTGKITGVADGLVAAGSKEAVNGGQLDAVKAIANTGWKLTTDKTGTGAVAGSSVEQITPDETVTFIAGDNIAVEQAGNKVTVATKQDVVFDSVTSTDILGNTSILSATGIITQDKDGKKSASLSNTGLFVAEMNATGNTLSSSSLEAGKLTVKGTNTLVLDSVKGTLTGLSNKTLGSGDFASQGRAATEEQLNQAQSNVASILGGNAANNGGLLSMSNIGGTGESTIDDAIKSVNQVANNANKGWNVSTNGGTANNVKPNDTVDFSNKDGNVIVSNQGNNIIVDLNKDIDLGATGSVTTGDTKIDNNGLTIAGGPSVTKNGIDAGKQKVTNVADGKITADSQDAVNGGQIHDMMGAGAYDTNGNLSNIGGTGQSNINDAIAAVNKTAVQSKSTVTEGSNIKVVSNSNADGSTNYTVSTADDITLNSVTAKDINAGTVTTDKVVAGNTTIDSSGLSIKNGPSVTASGIDAGSKVVSNVSNGVQNSDAVNMGQLSQYLGGGAGYNNITQSFDAPNYQVNGGSYNNVGDALGALNQADQALGNRITNLGDQLQQAFYSTNQRIDDVEKKANAGIAAAMALENAPYIPGKYTYAAGAAYHGGENAIGLTLRKTADNGRWSLTGGVAAGSSGDPSVRVGISGVID